MRRNPAHANSAFPSGFHACPFRFDEKTCRLCFFGFIQSCLPDSPESMIHGDVLTRPGYQASVNTKVVEKQTILVLKANLATARG